MSTRTTTPSWLWPLFSLIILVAVLVRLMQLGQVPVSLYWDEMAMLVDAKSIATAGVDMHGRPWSQLLFPSYGDYKQPVYIWLAAASVKLFGASEFALRLPSAMMGVITVVVAGQIALHLFKDSRRIQLATMAVMALSPWSILFSRTGFEGHLAQGFVAISIWLLLKGKKHAAWLYLGAVIGAVATYTYFSVRFVWPPVALVVILLFILPARLKRQQFSVINGLSSLFVDLVFPLLVFGLLLIPMTQAQFYQQSNQFRLSAASIFNTHDYAIESNILRQTAGNHAIDRLFYHRHFLLLKAFAANVAGHLSLDYLFLTGDSNLRHGTGVYGLFLWPLVFPLLLGLYRLFDSHKAVLILLLVWWLAALVPASVPETIPHALRSLNALVPITLIIGVGLVGLQQRLGKMVMGLFVALWLVVLSHFLFYYFVQYPSHSADQWQDGYKQVAEFILAEKNSVDQVLVQHIDERFYLWVMAYGNYTGDDFRNWSSRNFKFSQIDNIYFETGVPPNTPGTYLLAIRNSSAAQFTEETGLAVQSEQVIYDRGQKQQFVIMKVIVP